MNFTPDQWILLRGIVARAAQQEVARVERMHARRAGMHSEQAMREAERLARDMIDLEAAVESSAAASAPPEDSPG